MLLNQHPNPACSLPGQLRKQNSRYGEAETGPDFNECSETPSQAFSTTVIQPKELEIKTPLTWAGCRRVYHLSNHHPFQDQAGSCRIIQVILHRTPSTLGRFAARCGDALQPMAPKARDEQRSKSLPDCSDIDTDLTSSVRPKLTLFNQFFLLHTTLKF